MVERNKHLGKLAIFAQSRIAMEERIVRFNEMVRQEVITAHSMGLSQADIARALGVSKQRVWQITQEHKKKAGE